MRAARFSFFSCPKSIIQVFFFFFLRHESKVSNLLIKLHDISGWKDWLIYTREATKTQPPDSSIRAKESSYFGASF